MFLMIYHHKQPCLFNPSVIFSSPYTHSKYSLRFLLGGGTVGIGNKKLIVIVTIGVFRRLQIDFEGWNCSKLTIFLFFKLSQFSQVHLCLSLIAWTLLKECEIPLLLLFIANFGSMSTIIGIFDIWIPSDQSRSHCDPILVPLTMRDILAGNWLNNP